MINTKRIDKNTVLICNRINSRDNMNIYSSDLEFSSNTMYNAITTSLQNIGTKTYYYDSPATFAENIKQHKNDIVISTIWSGVDSRNRRILIPALCESYNIKYVGADAYVQALAADKILSKSYCSRYGMLSPKGVNINNLKMLPLMRGLSYPIVLKPNFEGGSIGISDNNIVDDYEDALKLANILLKKYPCLIAEEYIAGYEVSACIVGKEGNIDLFEIVKISLDDNDYFSHDILGFESKKGGKYIQKRSIITSEVSSNIKEQIKEIFLSLGKVDFMRIDGRITKQGDFYLIELTPDCSIHPQCNMYASFQHNGYSYQEMINALLNLAI